MSVWAGWEAGCPKMFDAAAGVVWPKPGWERRSCSLFKNSMTCSTVNGSCLVGDAGRDQDRVRIDQFKLRHILGQRRGIRLRQQIGIFRQRGGQFHVPQHVAGTQGRQVDQIRRLRFAFVCVGIVQGRDGIFQLRRHRMPVPKHITEVRLQNSSSAAGSAVGGRLRRAAATVVRCPNPLDGWGLGGGFGHLRRANQPPAAERADHQRPRQHGFDHRIRGQEFSRERQRTPGGRLPPLSERNRRPSTVCVTAVAV